MRSLESTQSALISVIVPCFNEARTIVPLLKSVRAALPFAKLIVVDDGSTDGSGALIAGLVNELDLRHLNLTTNQGKGAAFRAGLELVDREYVVIQDADLEYNPADICRLLQHAVEHQLDAVYGSRYLNGGSANRGALANFVAVKLLALVLRAVHGLSLTDPASCYKLFRSELVKSWPLRSQGFEICQELNTKIARGYRFAELPIRYLPRSKKDGKKIVAFDCFCALAVVCRISDYRNQSQSRDYRRPKTLGLFSRLSVSNNFMRSIFHAKMGAMRFCAVYC